MFKFHISISVAVHASPELTPRATSWMSWVSSIHQAIGSHITVVLKLTAMHLLKYNPQLQSRVRISIVAKSVSRLTLFATVLQMWTGTSKWSTGYHNLCLCIQIGWRMWNARHRYYSEPLKNSVHMDNDNIRLLVRLSYSRVLKKLERLANSTESLRNALHTC